MRRSSALFTAAGVLLTLVLAHAACAHPHEPSAVDSAVASQWLRPAAELGLPSSGDAQAMGIAATLIPMAVFAAAPNGTSGTMAAVALVAGPAVGFAYGGVGARGRRGTVLRAILVGGSAAWMAAAFDQDDLGPAYIAFAAGATALGSAIWDLAVLPRHVRAENERVLRVRMSGVRLSGEVPGFALGIELRGR